MKARLYGIDLQMMAHTVYVYDNDLLITFL